MAARSANDTYRLESAPVIVINSASTKADHPERYVLTLDTSKKAVLRPESYESDAPLDSPGVSISAHYGGRPNWPTLTLELHNVGRSPAIYPKLSLRCNLSPADNLDYAKMSETPELAKRPYAAPWTVGRDYPHFVEHGHELFGSVGTPVIAAGVKAFVRIENRLAADVEIRLTTDTGKRSNSTTKLIDGTTEPLLLRSMR